MNSRCASHVFIHIFNVYEHSVCVCFCVLALYSYKQSCTCALPAVVNCGPAPDAPANGNRSGSGTTFGSTVTYTCDRGYTRQGPSRLTCMASRQWSGSAPTCKRKLLAIRCSTMDIHGHQKSIKAMILQCDDSWGFYRH